MNNITKIIAMVAVAVLATSAIAQGQGQGRGAGQGGGQGRGGGGFGGGQRGGMFGQQGGIMLLQRADVQADLNLSSEQKTALAGMQESMQTEMRAMFEEMRNGGGGGFDREAMQAAMKKVTDGLTKKVDGILKPEQTKRLKEIDIQLAGNRAILREDVQKDLGFTAAQTTKAKDLEAKSQEANMAVMEKMRNGELDREQLGEIRTKNDKILGDELAKILTAEQAGKLKAMAGKPFKADTGG